jgi:hypothetical protein
VHTGTMNREALADFLKHRRDALQPGDVGLHEGARRRTLGLLDTPAQIVSDLYEVLSQNALGRALFGVQNRLRGPAAKHHLSLVHRAVRAHYPSPGGPRPARAQLRGRSAVRTRALRRRLAGPPAGRAADPAKRGVCCPVGAPRSCGRRPHRQASAATDPGSPHARLPGPHRREPHGTARRAHGFDARGRSQGRLAAGDILSFRSEAGMYRTLGVEKVTASAYWSGGPRVVPLAVRKS